MGELENKRYWFFLITVLLLTSCRESTIPTPTNSPTPLPIPTVIPTKVLNSEEEYEIYDAVINLKYTWVDEIIIVDQTQKYEAKFLDLGFPNDAEDAFKNYLLRNDQTYQLENKFSPNGTDVLIVDNDYLDQFFNTGEDLDTEWRNFDGVHENSHGFVYFSRVGVNSQLDESIVYSELHCGGTCGNGTFYLLSKLRNTWRVIAEYTLFNA